MGNNSCSLRLGKSILKWSLVFLISYYQRELEALLGRSQLKKIMWPQIQPDKSARRKPNGEGNTGQNEGKSLFQEEEDILMCLETCLCVMETPIPAICTQRHPAIGCWFPVLQRRWPNRMSDKCHTFQTVWAKDSLILSSVWLRVILAAVINTHRMRQSWAQLQNPLISSSG